MSPINILTSSVTCFKEPNEETVTHQKYFSNLFIVADIQREVFSVIRVEVITYPHIIHK